jgi:multidrug resistance efflux pump
MMMSSSRERREEQDVDQMQTRVRSPVTGRVQVVFLHGEPSLEMNGL